jgi:hypothetical protein
MKRKSPTPDELKQNMCQKRLFALVPELCEYDSLTLERGLMGVPSLREFVVENFSNERHAAIFSMVWMEWITAANQTKPYWSGIKDTVLHNLRLVVETHNTRPVK